MADQKAYLAAKYLSGAKADAILSRATGADGKRLRKKAKRVHDDGGSAMVSGSGFVVQDDGNDDWGRREEEEEAGMVIESRAKAGFKPIVAKTPAPEEYKPAADEAPVIVKAEGSDDEDLAAPKKLVGGLQSAAELAAETERRKRREQKMRERAERELREAQEAARARGEDVEDHDGTVHRDATGRRIDTKALRVEQAKQRREEMEKAAERMEWGKGLVQREDKERKRREAEEIAAQPFARHADDARMNAEMKEVERWNDPAARFVTTKKSGPRRPEYTGPPPPPNRFGIKPGYRWDGVDRSNGFERRLAKADNERKITQLAAHQYSTEDM